MRSYVITPISPGVKSSVIVECAEITSHVENQDQTGARRDPRVRISSNEVSRWGEVSEKRAEGRRTEGRGAPPSPAAARAHASSSEAGERRGERGEGRRE